MLTHGYRCVGVRVMSLASVLVIKRLTWFVCEVNYVVLCILVMSNVLSREPLVPWIG